MSVQMESLHVTLADQAAQRFCNIPFQVPRGARSVEVRLRVNHPDARIDLGCEGVDGWRGWSGGARESFVIGEDAATPGYRAGALEEGLWSVVLGLHELPAEGSDVEVEVRIPAERPAERERQAPVHAARRGSQRDLPAPTGMRWYAGDFHAHSVHSDGAASIDELAAHAAASGLDFVTVTDHNTVSHHPLLAASAGRHAVTLVPGQEVTSYRGHANAFGALPWVDFRRPAGSWLDDIFDAGGIMSVNHPTAGDRSWQHHLAIVPMALELWHASWYADLTSTAPWAFLNRWGREVSLLGGSDWHGDPSQPPLGAPTTWVLAEDVDSDAILDAVRKGRTAVSVGVAAGETRLRPSGGEAGVVDPFASPVLVRLGDELVVRQADGAVLCDIEGRRRVVLGEDERVPATWGRSPYHLEDHRRRVLALCR